MLAIFAKLSKIYLNRWSDQFATPKDQDLYVEEWGLGLVGLSEDQISRALDKCRAEADWPPSIAKFRNFALGDSRKHVGDAYKIYQRALPKPRNIEVGRSALAGLKGVL